MDDTVAVEPFDPPGICALCHRILSSENDAIDLEAISICGDCKFLFLEESGTPSQDRPPRVRRTRYNNSSESIENMFSSLARRNQPAVSELDNQSVDSMMRTSSRTTPTGSRRWRRVLSDTESDGFDSVYGESDAISYGAYGGDSDASVDVHSFLGAGSIVDSDTDIDPMHAGLNQWSSDDDEWEEVEAGENTLGSLIARVQLRRSLASNEQNNWLTEMHSPEIAGAVRVRISEGRQVHMPNPFGSMEEQEASPFVGHSGDYLDARSFEELLERLAEADNSRRGAPPAAVSFVNNLERVVVDDNGLACAICKESLSVGSVVNRLPCLHLYHPSCIKPWLSARNSCPLCRYELPTDDMDYENRKQSSSDGPRVEEMQQQEEDVTFEGYEAPEMMSDDSGRGTGTGRVRWLFVAAPVVSLVGIALALWLGNPGAGGIQRCGSSNHSQRGHRGRRWWSLF